MEIDPSFGVPGVHIERIRSGDVTLNVALAGPDDGQPVLLLHGFPEFWYGWHKQIPDLAASGLRVIAPDQRGYNLSDKPRGWRSYRTALLSADIAALLDALNIRQADVVGHDWGGGVAFDFAMRYPTRLRRLAILNSAPAAILADYARRSGEQRRKSLYMLAFQLPWLPEAIWRAADFKRGTRSLLASSLPHAFTAADLEAFRAAWKQPGAQTAMLNWYRAALRSPGDVLRERIPHPTLILWGKQDAFLNAALATESLKLLDNGRVETIEAATHWLHHEFPQVVNPRLIQFLHEGQ